MNISQCPHQTQSRLWEIDFLRALAVLGMLLFHWMYLLDYYEIEQTALFVGPWNLFGDAIRHTFLAVVGLSLGLSYQKHKANGRSWLAFGVKTIKRGFGLLLLGGIITLLSFLVIPETPVRFGILSLIGLSLILLWPLVGRWYLLAGVMMLVLGLHAWFEGRHESLAAYVLGFYPFYWPSVDYFPVVPWLASVCGGAGLALLLFRGGERRYPFLAMPKMLLPVVWLGKER